MLEKIEENHFEPRILEPNGRAVPSVETDLSDPPDARKAREKGVQFLLFSKVAGVPFPLESVYGSIETLNHFLD